MEERLADRWQREQRTKLYEDVEELEDVGEGVRSELGVFGTGVIEGRFDEA